MAIDTELFLNWVESHYGDDYKIKGDEIKLNSVFADEDTKHHMWCNCEGGKKKRDNGVFRCWKTDNRGSLVTLVMLVDQCSYEEAIEILGGADANLRLLEAKLEKFWEEKATVPLEEQIQDFPDNVLRLPDNSYFLDELNADDFFRVQAEVYLYNRGLPIEGFLVCTHGEYRNRVIIPYYDSSGNLIYFNGRYIGKRKEILRYMGPPKEVGIGKEDVMYVPEWPPVGQRIWLTEGEFDAKSIHHAGEQVGEKMYAGAFGGKNLSEVQIEMVRAFPITLSLDRDKAGRQALRKMAFDLRSMGKTCFCVIPPEKYKDWNQMLEQTNPTMLAHYLHRFQKPVDDTMLMQLSE